MTAPSTGLLRATIDGEVATFNGTAWSGSKYAELLNAVRAEWDLHHYDLESRARRGLEIIVPASVTWTIDEVAPDPADPEAGDLPDDMIP